MAMRGFTLIEVLIASAIALLLGSAIVALLFQTSRLLPAISRHTDPFRQATILYYQLQRDLSGAQVPIAIFDALAKKESQPAEDQKNAPPTKPQEKKPKEMPIKKIFSSTVQAGGMLDTLTFISDNPLQGYIGPKMGTFIPKMVRISYYLREDPATKKDKVKRYVLLRQESIDLDVDKMKEPEPKKWYGATVAASIKSLKIEFVSMKQQKEEVKPTKEAKGKESSAPEIKYTMQTSKEWQERKIEMPNETKKEEKAIEPIIPQLLTITAEFYDEQGKRSYPFTFSIQCSAQDVYPHGKQDDLGARFSNVVKKLTAGISPQPPMQTVQQSPQETITITQQPVITEQVKIAPPPPIPNIAGVNT